MSPDPTGEPFTVPVSSSTSGASTVVSWVEPTKATGTMRWAGAAASAAGTVASATAASAMGTRRVTTSPPEASRETARCR